MKRLVSFGWKRFQVLFLSFSGDCGTSKSKQEGEMGPVDGNKWAANFSLREGIPSGSLRPPASQRAGWVLHDPKTLPAWRSKCMWEQSLALPWSAFSHFCLCDWCSFLFIGGIPTEQEYLSLGLICPLQENGCHVSCFLSNWKW